MIIDFAGGINESRVQEMINESLSFTASVINLTNASAEEIKTAFANPDGVLCLADYSGMTYFEQYRRTVTNGNILVYFYVVGAEADSDYKRIYDKVLSIQVTPSTGEVSISDSNSRGWAPNIIYDLDRMNAAQRKVLSDRLRYPGVSAQVNMHSFSVVWTYNGKRYVYSTGAPFAGGLNGYSLIGTSIPDLYTTANPTVSFCKVDISNEDISYQEYTSNIVLTPVL